MNLAIVIFGCIAPAAVWLLIPLHDWWYLRLTQAEDMFEEFGFIVLDRRSEWP